MTTDPEFEAWLQGLNQESLEEAAKSLPPEKVEEKLKEVKKRGDK